jgi:hypothetical protein
MIIQLDRRVLPLTYDPQSALGVDAPAYLIERLAEGHTLDRLATEQRRENSWK